MAKMKSSLNKNSVSFAKSNIEYVIKFEKEKIYIEDKEIKLNEIFSKYKFVVNLFTEDTKNYIKNYSKMIIKKSKYSNSIIEKNKYFKNFNIEKCLNSVFESVEHSNLELIEIVCVDDGSNDNTLDLIINI